MRLLQLLLRREVYRYDVDVLDYSATMEDVEKAMKL